MSQSNFKHSISSHSGVINYNRILKSYLNYWYYFVFSAFFFLLAVFVYHRYTLPVYQAASTLMLKSAEEKQMPNNALIEGIGLSPEMRNIENQTFIIKSFKIVKRAVSNLDFGIEYYADGWFKDQELYHSAPFYILMDSMACQPLNVPIYIKFLNDNKVDVHFETDGCVMQNFKEPFQQSYSGRVSFHQIVTVNEHIDSPIGSFRIIGKTPDTEGPTYYVVFRSVDDIASSMRGSLSVGSYQEESSILYLSVTGTSPQKLCRFLDELGEVVCEYNLEQKNEIATRSIHFIQKQLEMIADTLRTAQNKLLAFRKENRFMIPSTVSQKLADRYYESVKKQKELALKRDYFVMLNDKLTQSPYSTDFMLPAFTDNENSMVSKLVMELLELNNEYAVTQNEANTTNPYLSVIQQKIDVTRSNLRLAIDKMLVNIDMQENVIAEDIRASEDEMDQLPQLEKEYLEIDRTYKLNDAIYSFLLQKNSETQITKASNSPDNEIIDQAGISGTISPNKRNNYTRGFMLSLILPALIIGFIEFLNIKIRSKEDLDHLVPSVPLIGIIPHAAIDNTNVLVSQPHSIISESFRSLRTRLNFMGTGNNGKVISVTSTNVGDGKTFLSLNLASAYAVSGKKTILLGFDLRKPKMSELFQMTDKNGISNYLIGQAGVDEICYNGGQDKLCIMPAGDIPPNPSELIETEKTRELFQWLRSNFEVVVVDLPPVGVVTDARLLMHHADIHLYVTRYNHTRKDHFQHTVINLLNENISSIGLVFNDVQSKIGGYGSYYSEYYGRSAEA